MIMLNVLFLGTGNSARSIMAESILRRDGAGRFRSFSAGSLPVGIVHPLALKALASHAYLVDGLASKSWRNFADPDAPPMDFVLTVCDRVVGESCPLWAGRPIAAHWPIKDPATAEGTASDKERAFVTALDYLRNRISLLSRLPIDLLSQAALTAHLEDIGRIEGTT